MSAMAPTTAALQTHCQCRQTRTNRPVEEPLPTEAPAASAGPPPRHPRGARSPPRIPDAEAHTSAAGPDAVRDPPLARGSLIRLPALRRTGAARSRADGSGRKRRRACERHPRRQSRLSTSPSPLSTAPPPPAGPNRASLHPTEPGGSGHRAWVMGRDGDEAMDLFDVELGGRDEASGGPGGSCSWVTAVILGILVLLAVLVHTFFGWARDLLGALVS
ncbi:hypothetical protein SPW_1072 [Streptomyces sp. W007]|nr:hypothetical protein SPW_1072 [Streptomyces sp. W007]